MPGVTFERNYPKKRRIGTSERPILQTLNHQQMKSHDSSKASLKSHKMSKDRIQLYKQKVYEQMAKAKGKQLNFLKLPNEFISPQTKQLFDNFEAIYNGTYNPPKKHTSPQKAGYLTCKQEWAAERIGDYLGPKIPSLLEFLENKIHQKELHGVSQVALTANSPEHKPHLMSAALRQEEDLDKLMALKDAHHSNVVF